MLTQKIYKNGNSVAVTIPKELLRELNMRDGTAVMVEKMDEGVLITPKKKKVVASMDSKFAKMVDEFINDHEDVLAELAKR